MNRLLLYLGDTPLGDINKFAKNRHLTETLKSESDSATADTFTFDINWKLYQEFIKKSFDDDPSTMLRVGKTRIVFETDGYVRFAGYLSAKPARSGLGADQILSLTFYEYFARLSGDLVCDPNNTSSPMRTFTNVRANVYAKALIDEFLARASAAGETINWDYGTVNQLGLKTITYKDFQTISKALCDAMNNVEGAGKFDIVFRTDPEDYTHQYIDILKPRGKDKNIVIKYPSDGVYKLWAADYSIEATNDYASNILVAGNGQVGDPTTGEQTAKIGTASNPDFVTDYCYWRTYETASNLYSQNAVNGYAQTKLSQLDFGLETPQISLVGRPIAWGNAADEDNGLAVGDTFYFEENTDDGSDHSGFYRIIGLDTAWDDNGVATVTPTLVRDE
ncbi:MAG: hypothetical protein U0L97_02860 [Candidatus Saccharimonadaceae bacterium]|nr:hypothetical protein [Candidatus Saccharimonadaceae bacterium]